jgi:predicted nucleic acid-binding protein
MTPKNPKIFLDTSVVFAAVLSPTGGARKLLLLGDARLLQLVVGPTVIRECQEVVQRQAPASRPILAHLLVSASLEISQAPTKKQISAAEMYVQYAPDGRVLAEAMRAKPDWFVTHDREHFLKHRSKLNLPFEIATPGDVLQRFKDEYAQP